jgi:hypothetical protein
VSAEKAAKSVEFVKRQQNSGPDNTAGSKVRDLIDSIKTVRNNLFHGGKSDQQFHWFYWFASVEFSIFFGKLFFSDRIGR